ncbi:MAG: YIP1 family protein [Desulfobulbaceae bacterium]|nr:MAG: YIP1 family protein [Desulfobulbaceae bacterium]
MNFQKLQTRVLAILKSPKTEWPVIAGEQTTVRELYFGYILVLAAISAVAGFLKMSLIGIDMPMLGTYRVGIGAGIGNMLFSYALTLAAVYLVGMVVNMLAPSFGGVKDDIGALKVVAYSYTASWVAGVFQIVPGIGMLLALAGSIYSIYLLYLGLPVLMRCPREKAIGYTAVAIVLSMILSFAISFITSGITGGMGMTPGSQIENSGSFDKDSPGGKIEDWAKKMESAGKEMEAAQQSGDAQQQQEAMSKMMTTALGSDSTVETLAPERIKSFLPDTLSGYTRAAISAERTAAMGFQISTASASYENGSGNMLDVEITDMGVAKGVMALAGWFGVEQEKTTETGYEKTYKQGNDFIHEQWDSLNGSGEYTKIVGQRFMVKISGSAVDIEVFRDALKGIDMAGLEALKDEGVKKGE